MIPDFYPGKYFVKVTVRDGQTDYKGENQNTFFTVDPSYTVTIPAKVKLGQTADVKAEGVFLGIYRKLCVSMRSDFKLTDGEESVNYTVKNGETQVASGDVVLNVPYGETPQNGISTLAFDVVEDSVQYAGNYTGTVTFLISIE